MGYLGYDMQVFSPLWRSSVLGKHLVMLQTDYVSLRAARIFLSAAVCVMIPQLLSGNRLQLQSV